MILYQDEMFKIVKMENLKYENLRDLNYIQEFWRKMNTIKMNSAPSSVIRLDFRTI